MDCLGKVLYLNIVRIVNHHRGFSVFTAIVLLAVFFFMMFGQQYLFLSKRYAIRKEIKRKIKNGVDEKDMFFFHLSDVEKDPTFYWENDHEFHFRGSMYDVVKRNGDVVKCINDDQEAKLFAGLDRLVRKRMDSRSSDFKPLSLSLFLMDPLVFPEWNNEKQLAKNHFDFSGKPFDGYLLSLFSPPECA